MLLPRAGRASRSLCSPTAASRSATRDPGRLSTAAPSAPRWTARALPTRAPTGPINRRRGTSRTTPSPVTLVTVATTIPINTAASDPSRGHFSRAGVDQFWRALKGETYTRRFFQQLLPPLRFGTREFRNILSPAMAFVPTGQEPSRTPLRYTEGVIPIPRGPMGGVHRAGHAPAPGGSPRATTRGHLAARGCEES